MERLSEKKTEIFSLGEKEIEDSRTPRKIDKIVS